MSYINQPSHKAAYNLLLAHAKVSQTGGLMLTDREVKAAKVEPGKSTKYLNAGNGRYLRVLASGAKSWVYRLKDAERKTRWLDMGPYPSISLLKANTDAGILKQKRRQGIDPIEEMAAKKAQQKQKTQPAWQSISCSKSG